MVPPGNFTRPPGRLGTTTYRPLLASTKLCLSHPHHCTYAPKPHTTLHSTSSELARPCPSPCVTQSHALFFLFLASGPVLPSVAQTKKSCCNRKAHSSSPPKKNVSPPYRCPGPRDLLLPCHHPPFRCCPAPRRCPSYLQHFVAPAIRPPRGVFRGVQRQVRQARPTASHPRYLPRGRASFEWDTLTSYPRLKGRLDRDKALHNDQLD